MRLPLLSALVGLASLVAAKTSMMLCNEDNCLRAIQGSAVPTRHGTLDCSSYFTTTITPATITITHTATSSVPSTAVTHKTVTSTTGVVATSTSDIVVISTVDVAATSTVDVGTTSTLDVTITSTATVVTTSTDIESETDSSTTTTFTYVPKHRRNINNDAAAVENHKIAARVTTTASPTIPAYASPCSGSVRYSSACSCVGVTAHTITAPTPSTTTTITVSVPTVANTMTLTDSTAVATVTGSTATITIATGTVTDTETTTTAYATVVTGTSIDTEIVATAVPTETDATATTTSVTTTVDNDVVVTGIANCPVVIASDLTFYGYYTGSGFTEDPNNPGNNVLPDFPPITSHYAPTGNPCDVVQECANDAQSYPDEYYSFDLHYLDSQQIWECVAYINPNNDPGYFDIPNSDVEVAYGYTT